MKQEYEMEKIQAWTLQIFNNIVSIIILVLLLQRIFMMYVHDLNELHYFNVEQFL